jgi:hypothetical protein
MGKRNTGLNEVRSAWDTVKKDLMRRTSLSKHEAEDAVVSLAGLIGFSKYMEESVETDEPNLLLRKTQLLQERDQLFGRV